KKERSPKLSHKEKRILKNKQKNKSKSIEAALEETEKKEDSVEKKEAITTNAQTKNSNTPSKAEGKAAYKKARDHYKSGEYARALDALKIAKKADPDNVSLLLLEDEIKDEIKEGIIEDQYNKAMLDYQKQDYPSAREEFEAILEILPE
ncbi:MAG: hypothetical protein QGI05_00435, partial [Candidatus Omnitrophota bacterium]|nr:hypothetical protein [Candidatus Omnitrophota bacterium]